MKTISATHLKGRARRLYGRLQGLLVWLHLARFVQEQTYLGHNDVGYYEATVYLGRLTVVEYEDPTTKLRRI